MRKLKQLLNWFDIHGLFVLSAFLIVFIPLFPKIPLFDLLPGYIVRARAEDILIFLTAIIWIKDAYKKRFPVKTTYFWIVVLYAIFGIASIISAILLTQSIQTELLHIGKSSLHLFRYLEYFALFFFTYSSIKTKKQLNIILVLLTATILGVVFYGFGQEYFHFPLYSTMNREYSKGVTLYLQEGARPQSTFAGHYDLAAYLVIVLPIIFSLALSLLKVNFKKIKQTIKQKTNLFSAILHITHILGAWMLVTSGSKTALLAYLVGVFIVLIQYLKKLGNFKQQLKWGSFSLIIITVSLTLFLNFFAKTTRNQLVQLVKNTFGENSQLSNPDATPDDLVGDGIIFKQVSVTNADGSKSKKWVEERSTWSPNSLKYGLSMGIRLDTLWPNAIKGFTNNPLFGNGYSTLPNVDHPGEYNNEDSTDNNYLRTIGETGLFGFIVFYGFILIITIEILKTKTKKSPLLQAIKVGFLGSIAGLMINATYIDVFAASKVAYTFWALAGVILASIKPKPLASIKKIAKHFSKHWTIYLSILAALFLLHKNPVNKYALIRNLDVSNAQIESLTTAKCFIESGSLSVCRNNGLILKKNFNLYSILLIPTSKIYNNPVSFYILNMSLLILVLILINITSQKLVKKIYKRKPSKILIISSLFIYTLIITNLNYSTQPLSNFELLSFLVILPILIIIYTTIIHNIKYRLAYFTQICTILVVLLFLINQDFNTIFLNQYRNDQISNKYVSTEMNNIHFSNENYLNQTQDSYLITATNPYYIDLFSNGNYDILPLSEAQPYFSQAQNVYKLINKESSIISQLNEIIKNNNLYATDQGTQLNEVYMKAFKDLKNNFDLTYIAVGCEDACSLFTVQPETTKYSPKPLAINNQVINPNALNSRYSFSIVSNRYEPKTNYDASKKAYSSYKFAPFLNSNLNFNNSFAIITGDTIDGNSKKTDAIFNSNFNKLPIIYTPGNFDINPNKLHNNDDSYFYTQSEFFLLLDIPENSEISSTQQRFIYNALLEMEKLAEIKNIIIVSHNLNWQDRENPDNFIFELERKLNQFPELNKYIVTSHHSNNTDQELIRSELSIKHITDSTTNINYLSSFIRDWDNDSYFEFTINTDNSVTVEYKVKGENF